MSEQLDTEFEYAHPGSVHYMKAPALRRGMKIPGNIKGLIAAFGLVALALAAFFGFRINDNVVNAQSLFEESIAAAINSGPGLELPVLNNYVGVTNEEIRQAISGMGWQTIDVDALYASPNEEVDANSLDLVKIPSDMEYSQAESLFTGNLRRVDTAEALHYLASSWRFTSYATEGIDLKVKYADFHSESIEQAIANAISAQGWTDSTFGESGVDQSGNTYQNGTIQVNEINMHWSISVCPLDEVYNVSGLPENSYYVGARLVQ